MSYQTIQPILGPDVLLLVPSVFRDDRGQFTETWNSTVLEEATGRTIAFVQDNQSTSRENVLRGLHYQVDPRAQGKLVRVIRGSAFDVVVDIRRSSPNFGQWTGVELSDHNRKQLWIPPGYAHGFLSLTDPTDLVYKVTDYYSPEHDRSIHWDDPDIGIQWPLEDDPQLSKKDAKAPWLRDADVFA